MFAKNVTMESSLYVREKGLIQYKYLKLVSGLEQFFIILINLFSILF